MKMIRMLVISVVVLMTALGVGSAAIVLSKNAFGNQDVEKVETGTGDLVADSVRSQLRTDIAFIAASELKANSTSFPAGNVSSDDVAALISYPDDPLAELNLTGKAIRQALERAVSIYPQPNLGFLQVSGLEFSFNPSRKAGERVASVNVNGVSLIDSRNYSVAVTNSMANGAIGYWKVWSASEVKTRYSNETVAKAVADYFTSRKTVDYGVLDRITVVK
ncbi:MAG: 5'-nucleotidase [Armatimonadota bacterium]|nr:5'-nucleotidase C-terminal domain-containing protein [bacterium]